MSENSIQIVDDTFVYALNEEGHNRWSFQIQAGFHKQGVRTTKEECAQLAKDFVTRYEAHAALKEALTSLRNEVAGMLGCSEEALRQELGNTNVNCLQRKLDDADKAIHLSDGK